MQKVEMTIDGVSFGLLSVQSMSEKDFIAEYMEEKHEFVWPGPNKEERLKSAYVNLTKTPTSASAPVAEPVIIDTAHKLNESISQKNTGLPPIVSSPPAPPIDLGKKKEK